MGPGWRDPERYCTNIYCAAYEERLCPDVLLKAFGNAYPAHRVILVSQSTYFSAWVRWGSHRHGATGHDDEERPGLPSHELILGEDVTQRGFEWILQYFYAAPHLAISSDNVFDVLAAAHYLGVTPVQTACVEFLSQHLDPGNLASCLAWATRADHGEASNMLAAACRTVLALRLPRHLAAWAPALPHIHPPTLLDILASDRFAVPSEYDRYLLVKEVAALLAEAGGGGGGGRDAGDGSGSGGCAAGGGAAAVADAELARMLSSALHVADARLARHLHLARSCPAAIPCPKPPPASGGAAGASAAAAAGGGIGVGVASSRAGGGDVDDAGGGGPCSCSPLASSSVGLPSDCAGGEGTPPSSQASSRSLARSCCGSSGTASAAEEEGPPCGCGGEPSLPPLAGRSVDPALNLQPPEVEAAALETPTKAPADADADSNAPEPAGSAQGGQPTGLASCARLLLDEAVRYEHLTVPQLMAVQAEGLVAPHVLHTALWERTRLDYALALSALPLTPECGMREAGPAAPLGQAPPSPATAAPPPAAAGRAFRFCWVLAAGSLKKLGPRETLQSEAHQYGGSLWRLRLCCTGACGAAAAAAAVPAGQGAAPGAGAEAGAEACRAIGVYVGRQLMPTAVVTRGSAQADGHHGHRGRARYQNHEAAWPQPPQLRQRLPRPVELPARAPPAPLPPPHQRQLPSQPQPQLQAHAFCPYVHSAPSLRCRCRVSVWQSDNTAVQGRLCLGDSGDFTTEFVAGGYFGHGRLVQLADLAALPDDADVYLFVSLHALVSGVGEAAQAEAAAGQKD